MERRKRDYFNDFFNSSPPSLNPSVNPSELGILSRGDLYLLNQQNDRDPNHGGLWADLEGEDDASAYFDRLSDSRTGFGRGGGQST